MAYYRLYFFDGGHGGIGSFVDFEVHSDQCAWETAEAVRRRFVRQELWCGPRKVAAWPALSPAATIPRTARAIRRR